MSTQAEILFIIFQSAKFGVFKKTPSEPAEYICEIPVGAAVEYLGSYNGYDKVYYNGMVGYVTSAYVR